tara:strand:- start:318 stop:1376 length:1059 start_codon:yes stop_codon:yes gene_type:complete
VCPQKAAECGFLICGANMATAPNPFDLSSKTAGKDLLTAATGVVAAPQATGYDAATAGAFGYDASNATSGSYTPTDATVTNWAPETNQTVQGQLSGILTANSPLLQQARAASLAQMNQRGLTNSSMAIGAGQEAVIKQALPIAAQDATTFANAGQLNATAANQLAQFNKNQANTALQFGAGASNQAALANAGAQNQASQYTSSALNQAALTNAANQNQAAQFSAGMQNEASKQYATSLNASVQTMLDQSMKYALSNADSNTKIELQNIDADTRKDLAATEAAYKNQMQASQSANDIFQQVSKNIADLMANPDLDTTEITAAVKDQQSYLKNALGILSATSGIKDLKTLVTFT